MNLIHQACSTGTDAGQLTGQMLGYFRDVMAVRVGCGDDVLLNCSAADMDGLKELGERLGLQTVLTIVQIFDSAMVRMQSSLHKRTLLEVAAIRSSNLEKLDAIPDLIKQLSAAGGAVPVSAQPSSAANPVKKNEVAKPAAVESLAKLDVRPPAEATKIAEPPVAADRVAEPAAKLPAKNAAHRGRILPI